MGLEEDDAAVDGIELVECVREERDVYPWSLVADEKTKRGFFLLVCKCEKFLLFFLSQVFFCFAGSPTPADSPLIITIIITIIIIIETQTLF